MNGLELGKKLAYLRKKNGFSQQKLAEKLEVSRQAVSRWEVGSAIPAMDNLIALSRLYGIPIEEIIGIDQPDGAEQIPANPIRSDIEKDNIKIRTNKKARRNIIIAIFIILIIGTSLCFQYYLYQPDGQTITNIGEMERDKIPNLIVDDKDMS